MAVIASYGDSVIYKSDVQTLSGPEYISDNVISIFMELLNAKCSDVFSLSPSVVQLMKMTQITQLKEMFEGLELHQYQIIFCPVNDSNSSTSHVSGQHWSLLCYVHSQACFFHLDSSNSFNDVDAKGIASRISSLLLLGEHNCQFKTLSCSQQNNGYDCGLYVIYFAKQIINDYIKLHKFDSKCILDPLPVQYRSHLLSEIEELS